jgi:transglutaminase-like putative cysteine protease
MNTARPVTDDPLTEWIASVWRPGGALQTYTLLQRFNRHIQATESYKVREEQGVQSADETLACGSGSCRDFVNLFMEAGRHLGLGARFVSGYLNASPSTVNFGATHARAKSTCLGAGWTGFDPTLGELAGSNHIAVAVSRRADAVRPSLARSSDLQVHALMSVFGSPSCNKRPMRGVSPLRLYI